MRPSQQRWVGESALLVRLLIATQVRVGEPGASLCSRITSLSYQQEADRNRESGILWCKISGQHFPWIAARRAREPRNVNVNVLPRQGHLTGVDDRPTDAAERVKLSAMQRWPEIIDSGHRVPDIAHSQTRVEPQSRATSCSDPAVRNTYGHRSPD